MDCNRAGLIPGWLGLSAHKRQKARFATKALDKSDRGQSKQPLHQIYPTKTLNIVTGDSMRKILATAVFDELQEARNGVKFAERAYLASLEAARAEVRRTQVYLSVIVPPKVHGESVFPKPIAHTASTFAITSAVWMIALMRAYAVREHM